MKKPAEENQVREFTELCQFEVDSGTVKRLDQDFCIDNGVVILKQSEPGSSFYIAGMLEPDNEELLKKIKRRLRAEVKPVQLNEYEIRRALAKGYASEEEVYEEEKIGILRLKEKNSISFDSGQTAAKILDDTIAEAVKAGASDIHIENYCDDVDLRFRIDGVMHQITTPLSPENIKPVTGRLKVLSFLNLAEHMMPQDGRLKAEYKTNDGTREIDLRISIIPSRFGENIVIRLLDPEAAISDVDKLGLDAQRLAELKRCLEYKEGIILVTGPSGSGKTTSLYSCLQKIASPDVKILTVEDPVEYEMPKICQHQVSGRMRFADYARAFLRHDPDVLMIGEIRDEETASLAVRAAMTGHLVFSTMHANDAISAISRFRDLGVPDSSTADVLRAVIAQRLVRNVCPECKNVSKGNAADPVFSTAVKTKETCSTCGGIGYKGRTGIFEMFVPNEESRLKIANGASVSEIRYSQGAEYKNLFADGMEKVSEGITTEKEIRRVVQG